MIGDLATPIDLAHEASFALGALTVKPSTREVLRDTKTEVLEPRVMQVLVALHRAGGAIVSRDDLTLSCWGGRVVGEDAINRVISRLRRTAQGIGRSDFRIETVTKVGYRLVSDDQVRPTTGAEVAQPSRRGLLAAGAAAGLISLGAGGWLLSRNRAESGPPPSVAPLMTQAELALYQGTREGQNQAIGLYQQVVAAKPNYADGWGALATAYATAGHYRPTTESLALRQRAREAAQRALMMDARNGYAKVGLAIAQPRLGTWWRTEQALRDALVDHPDHHLLLYWLSAVLGAVGRVQESAALGDRLMRLSAPTPELVFNRIMQLWAAGRQEECDRLMAEGGRLYPTHFAVWFSRFYVQLYTGRPGAALAMAADEANRPSGIPAEEIAAVTRVAQAAASRRPDAIAAVMAEQRGRAHDGTGFAENAMQFACLLGQINDAFMIGEAYYLGKSWAVPDVRFTSAQGTYLPRGDRLTILLFNPATAPMRVDRRFQSLVRDLGLEEYWRLSKSVPDFRRRA